MLEWLLVKNVFVQVISKMLAKQQDMLLFEMLGNFFGDYFKENLLNGVGICS